MRALIAATCFVLSAHAHGEKLALGSMEVQGCAKGKERATLILEVSAPQFQRVHEELRLCAEHGVAAATLPALLKKTPAAALVFWEEFQLCSRYTEWEQAQLFVERSCR
jgi:hypothetical protein